MADTSAFARCRQKPISHGKSLTTFRFSSEMAPNPQILQIVAGSDEPGWIFSGFLVETMFSTAASQTCDAFSLKHLGSVAGMTPTLRLQLQLQGLRQSWRLPVGSQCKSIAIVHMDVTIQHHLRQFRFPMSDRHFCGCPTMAVGWSSKTICQKSDTVPGKGCWVLSRRNKPLYYIQFYIYTIIYIYISLYIIIYHYISTGTSNCLISRLSFNHQNSSEFNTWWNTSMCWNRVLFSRKMTDCGYSS